MDIILNEENRYKISFIIPLLNEEKSIYSCLISISKQAARCDEIIVVDNGSIDNSLNIVKTINGITLISRPEVTVGALRNEGAKYATGDLLAFIDADCELCCDWRTNVCLTLQNMQISATGSKYEIPLDSVWIERAWYSQKIDKMVPAKYINSGNLIVRNNVFKKSGGFNEELVTGEDSELCWRLNKAGYLIVENPHIKAIHLGNPKNLKNFYEKQKWHSVGMMGTYNISRLDLPLITTIIYMLILMLCVVNIAAMATGNNHIHIAYVTITICIVPISATIYRLYQFKNYRYSISLVALYFVYYCARSVVLFNLCANSLCSNLKSRYSERA